MELLSPELIAFLFAIAVLAGFIDTLAGGGGLIAMPALLIAGVPPLAALGTNKLQGCMGTGTASFLVLKNKKVLWRDIKYLVLSAFIGSSLGAIFVQFINTDTLSFIIPVILVLITLYFLFSSSFTRQEKEQTPQVSSTKYRNLIVPIIGSYDGMFGPGTGSFFALAGISCRGKNLINATAEAKPLNFSTNISALIVFAFVGEVVWVVGGLMMLGQVIGAWLGVRCLFKINPTYLRVLVVVMCLGMLLRYVYSLGFTV